MLKNYLLLAWRNALKHKAFSLINLLGLVLGIATCLIIAQYVAFELSYDRFHAGIENIYRVVYTGKEDVSASATTPPALAPALKASFPQVKEATRLTFTQGSVTIEDVQKGSQVFDEGKFVYTDNSFLDIFNFPLLAGDKNALAAPAAAIVTESFARKVFGTNRPIGQSLTLHNQFSPFTYTIRAVIKDIPANSHLQFDVLFSLQTLYTPKNVDNNSWASPVGWDWGNFYTYVRLTPQVAPASLAALFMPQLSGLTGWKDTSGSFFELQALQDIHLRSTRRNEPDENGDIRLVFFLSIVATLILLVAVVNALNLSTARAGERAKEVGIRKVSGASRLHLCGQFLGESLLVNTLALILALTLQQLLQPFLSDFTGKPLGDFLWMHFDYLSLLIGTGVFIMVVLLSGAYPALLLSSFSPERVLKGRIPTGKGGWLRKGLVVFQFAASVALIAGTIVVGRQLTYLQSRELGINLEQVLVIESPAVKDNAYDRKTALLKREMLQVPAVRNASYSMLPGKGYGWTADFTRDDLEQNKTSTKVESKDLKVIYVDADFLSTFEVKLLAGPLAGRSLANYQDDEVVLLNEAATKALAFTSAQAALGKKISSSYAKNVTIAGVINDYHHKSLKETLDPMVLFVRPNNKGALSLRLSLGDDPKRAIEQTLSLAKQSFGELFPGNPFRYVFLEDSFQAQYRSDQQFGNIFSLFTSIAISLACLGLLGLAHFVAVQRTKEVGVRKVLGATTGELFFLLTSEFMRLVLVAGILAIPVSIWGSKHWLENFAYRIELNLGFFLLPMIIVLLIALLTIGFQMLKIVRRNPIDSLRYE